MKVKLTTLICITFFAFATVQGLPYGLTENAVDAAKKIKYFPAIKDGKRVSMWIQLEYNFNLY